MIRAEGEPTGRKPLIRRIGEKLGILIPVEERAKVDLESQRVADDVRRYQEGRERQVDALFRSGDLAGKIGYILSGTADVDPYLGERDVYDTAHPSLGEHLLSQDSSETQTNS